MLILPSPPTLQAYLGRLKADLPELPFAATRRLVAQYPGLTPEDAHDLLTLAPETFAGIDFFEAAVAAPSVDGAKGRSPKAVRNWVVNYCAGALAREGKAWGEAVTAAELAKLVDLVDASKVTRASLLSFLGSLPVACKR